MQAWQWCANLFLSPTVLFSLVNRKITLEPGNTEEEELVLFLIAPRLRDQTNQQQLTAARHSVAVAQVIHEEVLYSDHKSCVLGLSEVILSMI